MLKTLFLSATDLDSIILALAWFKVSSALFLVVIEETDPVEMSIDLAVVNACIGNPPQLDHDQD